MTSAGRERSARNPYWPALDGLRGVAILLVVLAHTGFLLGPLGGQVGVTLFFVLSGFLITTILIGELDRTGGVSLKSFYKRRAVRLLPALVLFLVVGGVLIEIVAPQFRPLVAAVPALFYFANYAQIAGYPIDPNTHLWSLSVEEHFYLIWPLFLSLRRSIPTSRTLIALGLGLVSLRFLVGFESPYWAYHGSLTNSYAIVFGCAIGVARTESVGVHLPRYAPVLSVFFISLIAAYPAQSHGDLLELGVWVPPVVAVLGAVAIWGLIHQTSAIFETRWLRYVGKVSYAWYLWHAPFLFMAATNDSLSKRIAIALATFAIATASWHFVESPILRRFRSDSSSTERTGVRS